MSGVSAPKLAQNFAEVHSAFARPVSDITGDPNLTSAEILLSDLLRTMTMVIFTANGTLDSATI